MAYNTAPINPLALQQHHSRADNLYLGTRRKEGFYWREGLGKRWVGPFATGRQMEDDIITENVSRAICREEDARILAILEAYIAAQ